MSQAHPVSRIVRTLQIPSFDPCLIVVINRTDEPISVAASAETPAGSSFLDSLSVDLEPEGLVSFTSCLANDLSVDFFQGPHVLGLVGNELRLLPGHGLRQKMTLSTSGFPTKYILVVEVDKLVESRRDPPRPSLADVITGSDELGAEEKMSLRKSVEALPLHCTVLWPRGQIPPALKALTSEELVHRLTVPMALFLHSKKGCSETLMDNSTVRIFVAPTGGIIFEVPLETEKEALFFRSSASELVRTLERFQLVYMCDVSAR
jgi:hypothetical protein